MTAVRIPTGSSSGAMSILAATSTHTTKIPPSSAEIGNDLFVISPYQQPGKMRYHQSHKTDGSTDGK